MRSPIVNTALSLTGLSCVAALTLGCGSQKSSPGPALSSSSDLFVPPPTSAERASLSLDRFDVPPGGETYKCQNFANPFGKDVAILQSQSHMSEGSHHLAVFRFTGSLDAGLEDCSGLEFHNTVHAAQTPSAVTTYPDGVGVFLPASEGIRMNAHYVNFGADTVRAEVDVALDYVDADAVTFKAAQIYLNDGTLDVPPGKGTAGGTLALPLDVGDVKLISAQSHMHRHGMDLHATLEDGSTLYDSTSWNEPPVKVYDPPQALAAGSKINWKCDIQNDTTADLTFGESGKTNEMCVLTGFYYPAPGGQTIVGDVAVGGSAFLLK